MRLKNFRENVDLKGEMICNSWLFINVFEIVKVFL